ncbi:HpcH/HpaI aldolase/citrate lyase family protein [Polycladidibacter stylochi]|uniref:HpcH/HpaI aldolase/citrate lyase family protein n=1 Tax=Polycladidibacter stylochi TaxID=1807766 RepID=UPI0008318F3B|nr:CoA ester lyase [Pseudovibrio stylochi]
MCKAKAIKNLKPRRSVLYMPGSNARALEKGRSLPCDALILDLEDAVAPEQKQTARQLVCQAVQEGGYGYREVVIRINGFDTEWGLDDLEAATKAKPHAILMPKVSSANDLWKVAELMEKQGVSGEIDLWIMMETPKAILAAKEIAETIPHLPCNVGAIVIGTNDLAKETGAKLVEGRQAFLPWLMSCVATARVAKIDVIDGVYNDFSNSEGFLKETEQGALLGMNGKTLIHPKQIAVSNDVFSPNQEEVEWAKKVIAAFNAEENKGKGALQVEGKMVERLHAEQGEKVVAMAECLLERG